MSNPDLKTSVWAEQIDPDEIRRRIAVWLENGGMEQLQAALAEGQRTAEEFARAAEMSFEDWHRPCGQWRS